VEVTAGKIYSLPVNLRMQQQSTTVDLRAALTLDNETANRILTIASDVVGEFR